MTSPVVLIVDDDADIRRFVTHALEREAMAVRTAESRAEMARALAAEPEIDLVLLDVRLPDGDGFDALKELRQDSSLPVIMLTGMDTPMDRVLGLEFGADDYIGKPFDPKELAARVRSVLRRSPGVRESEVTEPSDVLLFAGLTLDLTHRRLVGPDGGEIEMTGAEFDLLCALAQSPNRPLTRDQLLDRTRNRDWTPFDRSIDVLIGRLRKKIEPDPRNPGTIKTVRGVGYVLAQRVIQRSGAA